MSTRKTYFIKTFGCQQNVADSERIAGYLQEQKMTPAKDIKSANYIVINTCMVRESAENRVYGLVNNLSKLKKSTAQRNRRIKIVLTGCMVGMAVKDKSGKFLARLKELMPTVDEFLPIEEIGFDNTPLRTNKKTAYVPISNGCNNFCSYCVVPYTRGKEISRPYEEIIEECKDLRKQGYEKVLLLGQNVNSYGADLMKKSNVKSQMSNVRPVMVKHLGRYRIPTLFPYLLEDVARLGFKKVDFMSSNPWDFSDELINIIARNKNITRTIHLPVQSGDDKILKNMNRWHTARQYLTLISKLKSKISNLKLTTDIIVGFPGETNKQFENTVKLCKNVGFEKSYISIYSPRPFAVSTKKYKNNIAFKIKRKRWLILDKLINKKNL